MGQKISIFSIITHPTIIGVLIVFVLAFIYNLNHGNIFDAIKVVLSGIYGVILFSILIAIVVVTFLYHKKWEIIGQWIIDRLTRKKR